MPLTSDGFPDGPVEDPHDIVVKNMWDMEGRAVSRESPSLSKRFIKTPPESGQGFFRLQKVLLLRRRNDSTRYDSGEMLRYLEAGIGEDKPNDMLKMLRHMETMSRKMIGLQMPSLVLKMSETMNAHNNICKTLLVRHGSSLPRLPSLESSYQ